MPHAKLNPEMRAIVEAMSAKLATETEIIAEIQARYGVTITKQAVSYYRQKPHVQEARRKTEEELIATIPICKRVNRLRSMDKRHRAMEKLMKARGNDPFLQAAADGDKEAAGLLVKTVKGVGSGESFQMVELVEVDTGLLREMREHERQVAQETGQWTEKRDVTSGGQPVPATFGIALMKVYGDDDSDDAGGTSSG
jgi:hypothetical protein